MSDCGPQPIETSLGRLAQQRFELGEGVLDRVASPGPVGAEARLAAAIAESVGGVWRALILWWITTFGLWLASFHVQRRLHNIGVQLLRH